MNKQIMLVILMLFIPAVLNCLIPLNNISETNDEQILLKGIEKVYFGGVPGDLMVFGPKANVVLTNREKKPVIAAASFGKGRAIAVGHGSFFSAEAVSTPEGVRLVNNILNLNPKKEKAILCAGFKDLAAMLEKENENLLITSQLPRRIDQFDVIFMEMPHHNDPAFREAAIKKLNDYVYNGGVLVASAIGWVFNHYGEGKQGVPLSDFYGNKLFTPMGIAWGSGYAGGDDNYLKVKESVGNASHGLLVINEAIARLNSGNFVKNLKEARSDFLRLHNALNEIQNISHILTEDQITAIMKYFNELKDEILPTRENSIPSQDIEAVFLIAFADAIIKKGGAKYLDGTIAGDFPGNADGAQSITKELLINTAIPRWHSTGLYAVPGREIKLLTDKAELLPGLEVQIGSHTDDISQHDSWNRWPFITDKKAISEETKIMNPHGGLIYIIVPNLGAENNRTMKITVENAIAAPFFVLGQTSLAEWKKQIETTKAPWGEIASDNLIITVPTETLKKLDNPEKNLKWWDRITNSMYELGQIRQNTAPERFVCDLQISIGYMHSGYPVMTHLDVADKVTGVDDSLYKEGSWGHFHELGHNNQNGSWTFKGTGEVTVNLFTLYAMEKIVGIAPYTHPWFGDAFKRGEKYLEQGSFNQWQEDPALALIMYAQLQREFGWQPFKNVFAEYLGLTENQLPQNDGEKRDQWMVRFSKEVGFNLGPFFKMWKIPVSESALKSISQMPAWKPKSLE